MERGCTFLAALTALLLPVAAAAHGGPPVSQQILISGDQLIVPTQFWGVFLGTDGGPWRWICEEAINKYYTRTWARTGDGTYHVTDTQGITTSKDGGCTWVESTGDLASRPASTVAADPIDPKRAWTTTAAGSQTPWNALFTTVDDGDNWTPVLKLNEFLRPVLVSPDGQTLYFVGFTPPQNGPVQAFLHVSRDRGATFTSVPLTYTIGGALPEFTPLAIDPADASTVYLGTYAEPTRTLIRLRAYGTQLDELLQLSTDIYGVAFDASLDSVLLATAGGLWRSVGGQPFATTGGLSTTQCVTTSGATVYACTSNYPPDNAAVARSDDGGEHFRKVFQYAEALGTTQTCAPTTPVGAMCPALWNTYSSLLTGPVVPDAGSGGGGGGGDCSYGASRRAPWGGLLLLLLLFVAVGWRARAR